MAKAAKIQPLNPFCQIVLSSGMNCVLAIIFRVVVSRDVGSMLLP